MDAPEKPTERCVVCAQPAEKLKCVKCKTPYCSVSCQTMDWKECDHKKECKRLVKANAAAAAKGTASGDAAPTPPPAPKPKATPPVVDGPARGRADIARAKAAAAAKTAKTAPAPEPEHWSGDPRCPVCLEDWDVNANLTVLICCCKHICFQCNDKLGEDPCPLCRMPWQSSNEEQLARLRRHENKNPAAIRELGSCYEHNQFGLVPSLKKAMRLYQRAADLGDVLAMYYLGVSYQNGRGLKLDTKKAVKYFRMAADRGDARAQYALGICFKKGRGVARDDAEAFRFYKLAAEQGLTEAEFALGVMYAIGLGVTRDVADVAEEAVRLLKGAAAKGNEGANGVLAKMCAVIASSRESPHHREIPSP